MSDLLHPLALIFICLNGALILFKYIRSTKNTSSTKHLFMEIKSILQPPNTPLRQMLEERALANQRLVRALHLSNTFVSGDEAVHKEFVSRAQYFLNNAQRKGWSHFQSVARDAVQWQLASSVAADIESRPHHDLDTTIQAITLFVVLVGLLDIPTDPTHIPYQHVSTVAHSITKLWTLSKSNNPIPPSIFTELEEALRCLVPDAEVMPAPLDFVIPAWETMWRVVATAAAYSSSSPEACEAFAAFNTSASREAFHKVAQNGISVQNIVAEAMRLHPPSKRISRVRKSQRFPRFLTRWVPSSIVKADVGALLLDHNLWGENYKAFVPGRHDPDSLRPEQQEAMSVVFGQGRLRCIASSWAPVAASVIVGVVLEEYSIISGGDVGGREGWKGWALTRRSDN